MESRRVNAKLAQARNLIIHQSNKGGNNQPHAFPAQGGYLVTDTFAAAGWHKHQCISAFHNAFNGLRLKAAKTRKAKNRLQDFLRRFASKPVPFQPAM
ncbi:hypothetical protein AA18889_0199 [Acetobacter senegalensis DSM 18889]|nr:hypothetical protein AA18889_0199 [Acetobacter senegalensis DSM 18889]